MVQERPVRVERRLSAILAADVAGYSRLMHYDEEATHAKLTALLADAVEPAIAEHGGRIVKNTGDGFLAEFPSAVEAVRAAVQFQTRIKELTIGEAEDRRIAFRVGVNIGDVIVEPHDIFGDGVNIAARLESIAEPGGICISSSAYDHVRGKVGVEFADLGEQNLKNIARPVRAYAVVRDGPSPATQAERARPGPLSPPRLSIVVLPFANLSGDPEQDYFVDGVTESLTTDLSRISGSFVIGRHTAFTYKGKAVDLKQIGRELNVRYVLEGSVQRGGNRLRVNVQLIDAETGNHLWAERFDKPVADLFDMQDEIVSRLANTLNAQLIEAEARRAERSLHPDAMDLYFQGMAWLNKGLDPRIHGASARLFRTCLGARSQTMSRRWSAWRASMRQAATLFSTDDRIERACGGRSDLDQGAVPGPAARLWPTCFWASSKLLRTARPKALPNASRHWRWIEIWPTLMPSIGIAKVFHRSRRGNRGPYPRGAPPFSSRYGAIRWMSCVGFAKLQLGADAEAVAWLRRSIEANRNYPIAHFDLAAALALLGDAG